MGFSAIVRVTLKDGTFHEDVGFGDCQMRNLSQCFENAMKSAVTDARKRALRVFGAGMGNSVYDKKNLALAMKRKRQRDQHGRSSAQSTNRPCKIDQNNCNMRSSENQTKPCSAVPTFNVPQAQTPAQRQADQNNSLPINTVPIQEIAAPSKNKSMKDESSPLKLLGEREDEFAEFDDFDLDDVARASQEARKRQKVEESSGQKKD